MKKSIILAVTFYAACILTLISFKQNENVTTIAVLAAVFISVAIVVLNPIKSK